MLQNMNGATFVLLSGKADKHCCVYAKEKGVVPCLSVCVFGGGRVGRLYMGALTVPGCDADRTMGPPCPSHSLSLPVSPVPSSSGASIGSDTWLARMEPWVSSRAAMAGSRTPQLATDRVMRMLFTMGSSHRK